MRHSLLVRLLAISTVIAACSIAATAWLAVQSTTGSIQRDQGQALATDATIYDSLLGYAATHASWADVGPTIDSLAKRTGRRIALSTPDRRPIADSSGPSAPPLPVNQTVVVDPLAVDLTLKPGAGTDRIDERAVGPYKLPPEVYAKVLQRVQRSATCARQLGYDAKVVDGYGARPTVEFDDAWDDVTDRCGAPVELEPSERGASAQLVTLANACLARQGGKTRQIYPDKFSGPADIPHYARADKATGDCLDTARREQLAPHVAPAALLFLTNPGGRQQPRTDLSTAGTTRIALTALAVLLLTALVSTFAATRLVRPIRALTSAAQRMGAGDRGIRVGGDPRGELGQLAVAFNAMSARLEETENQRKTMVGDIAHELRTPLGNIRGWLEATQDGVATLEPELVSSLLEETLVLQYLVNDLQDLALADAGQLRLHLARVDAAELVDQVAAAHQGTADQNGVTLRAASRGSLELVADPARLRQALGNLVANAVRYTPPGGEVTVAARRQDERLLFEVTDTGAGISPEDLPRVFDRFWRADKSRSRQTGGSGLGLAITRHLVEAHGGSATATSVPGKGSTFRISMPLGDASHLPGGVPGP